MLNAQTLHVLSCAILAVGMVLFLTRIFGANVQIARHTGGVLGRLMHVLNVLQTIAFGSILLSAALGFLDPGVALLLVIGILAVDALGTAGFLALIPSYSRDG